MDNSKPERGFFVYKRRKKMSELDKAGEHADREAVLVVGTPVKLRTTKVYGRKKSIKFQNSPLISPAFEASSIEEVSNDLSVKEPIEEKGHSSNETETGCSTIADVKENILMPLDTISSSFEHHSKDHEKDKNACINGNADDMVCFTCEKSNEVIDDDSDSRSPDSLGSSAASNTVFEPQDINGPVSEHPIDSKKDTKAYASEKSLDKGLDEDVTSVINKESVEVVNPATQGSKVDHFEMSSSSLVDNDKEELEENGFLPGDRGFLLLKRTAESEKDQSAKGPESSETESNDHPRQKEDSQGVGGKEDMEGSRKAPRKKAKKKSHRPRIMVDDKKARKTAKACMTKPADLREKTVPKKRKNNEAEVTVEPDIPGKQNSSKRRKNEKNKHETVIDLVTPISGERGMGVQKVAAREISAIADVARALIFDQESQPREENLPAPPVHVDEHDNPYSHEIAKSGCAAESVIPPDSDLVGVPNSVLVSYSNEVRDHVIDETKPRTEVLGNMGDQKYHAIETRRLSRRRKCLDSSKSIVPNCPELNKRRRTVRKPRTNIFNLVTEISSTVQEAQSRNSSMEGNMSKTETLHVFPWQKKSKRSARVRNMSKWGEISLCNRLLGCHETKKSHAKGIPKIIRHAQDVQNNKGKEPLLLDDNGSRSLGVDNRMVHSLTNSVMLNCESEEKFLCSAAGQREEIKITYGAPPFFGSRPTETPQMSKEIVALPHSLNYQTDGSRQSLAGNECSFNSELPLLNSVPALQNYDLVQNSGRPSSFSTERYPLVQSLEHAPYSFQECHQFVQDDSWLANNGASSLEHEVAAGNLDQSLLMCGGVVHTQNEETSALYQKQLRMMLNLYLEGLPLQFQETRLLYMNYMRSSNYAPSTGFLHLDCNKITKDNESLIQGMRSLDINEGALDLNATIRANTKQERKKGKASHPEKQLIVLNHAAQGPNMLVPYEEKVKRKTTAKVHLDPDTIKEWQLLMMNDLPGGPNADEGREEKWEAEREFFRGRVDLFIKRMHLLQADRKFKQWKGSVVDSVVGVYLTQNVSDHLSSNAYISLAATFPIEATEDDETGTESVENGTGKFETVVNSEGQTYFLDEPPEENKKWLEFNDLVVEDQGSTHVGTMSCKDIGTTLSEEINSDGCTMLSCDGGKVEHEASKAGAAREYEILGFHNMDNDLKSSFTSISSSEIQDPLNMEEKERSIPVEGQEVKTPEVQEPQKATQKRNKKTGVMEDEIVDWKNLRRMFRKEGHRDRKQMDSIDWDAVRVSDQRVVANAIKDRGQQTIIAGRIKDFLNQEVKENGTIDLEWLRDAPPDLVKRYLLEINGLGLKSVECIRLLALKHIAFPVDTNVGRIAVRLGWVPLEPFPDEVQMHLLDQYPYMDSIQKYLWPRLCRLPQATLYELHYQMITFGKVFCSKKSPNCNACPMKAECKHFASAYASSKLHLPGPQDKKTEDSDSFLVPANPPIEANQTTQITSIEECSSPEYGIQINSAEPIVEMPPSPTPERPELIDIEDTPCRTSCQSNGEIPEIDVDMETFKKNVHDALNIRKTLNSLSEEEVSKALVALTPEKACIPMPAPKLKYYSRLRTEHVVYVLPDDHELLRGFERREPDDPSPYLLTVWQPGEKSHSFTPPNKQCNSNGSELCDDQTCSYCCSIREENSKTLRGTILIPCRTAMRGSFPLNGTYFQINEVFADQQTSLKPTVFPREWTRGLEKRALYCGSSVSAIFRGLDTRRIQLCFWTGYVCVRGFHREKRVPQALARRLHTPPSKRGKKFERDDEE